MGMFSKRRNVFGAVAGLIVLCILIGVWLVHRQASQEASTQTALAGDPLLYPPQSLRLRWASPQAVTPKALSLPKGQLKGADWFWPITASSSVAYVLHDGQSRWLIEGKARTFASMPTDPIGMLVASPNGKRLAWPTPSGVESVHGAFGLKAVSLAGASSPFFESDGALAYILPGRRAFTAVVGQHRYAFSGLGQAFDHPFLQGALAYDDHGRIGVVSLARRTRQLVAKVNPRRWPNPLAAGSLPSGIRYFLLSANTPIPSYLLIIDQSTSVRYYAWQSPTIPEVAIADGTLCLTYIKSQGQLVVLSGTRLIPLNVSTNLFSAGAMGLVWQAPNAKFQRLSRLP